MSENVAERTLYHLAACITASEWNEIRDNETESGPADSSWADLLAALMEGLERDWVEEVHLYRENGSTQLRWRSTDRGDRAIEAFRRRKR